VGSLSVSSLLLVDLESPLLYFTVRGTKGLNVGGLSVSSLPLLDLESSSLLYRSWNCEVERGLEQ
jgi:hypothetical protein